MAITIKDQNKTAAASTITTASITLTSGKEYRMAVASYIAFPAPNAATSTGWTQVATKADNTHGAPITITTLRFTGDGSTSTRTIAFGGQTQLEAQYTIVEFADSATGAGSSVQTNSATSESGTGDTLLDAGGLTATSAANVVWIVGVASVNGGLALKAGYTTAGSQVSTTTQFMAGYLAGSDNAPSLTKPDFTYGDAIAEEIAAAATGSPDDLHATRGLVRGLGRGLINY